MKQNSSIEEQQILQHKQVQQSSSLLGSSIISSFYEQNQKVEPQKSMEVPVKTKRQRRGRPQSRKGISYNTVLEAKHYTTLWQAELFYNFKVKATTNSYSSEADELLAIQQLAPSGQDDLKLLDFLRNGQITDPLCNRLIQFLQKMRYARSPQIAAQFYQLYFQIIRQYINHDQNVSRNIFIDQMTSILVKGTFNYIRVSTRHSAIEERQFSKLIRIVCHCIVATIDNDPKAKQLSDFKY